MGDWTADAEKAIKICENWASATLERVQAQYFLFGSVIYKGGEQFDRYTSDLDIIAILPAGLDALDRFAVMQSLQERKAKLELEIIPGLGRSAAGEPGVSLVPITQLELRTNVHKSGVRRFFDRNIFLDIRSGTERVGLPDAGVATLPEENRAALEYVQKVRNEYLGKSANLEGGLKPYSGPDPLPKALLRAAAQLEPSAEAGEWYDTRLGLELMFDHLRERRSQPALKDLYNRIATRRGGRGMKQALSDQDQMMLAELLHDIAANVQVEDVVQWELRIPGGPFNDIDIERLIRAVRAVASDATLILKRSGSVILRFQSSKDSFNTVQMLLESGALSVLLKADDVELRMVDVVDDAAVGAGAPSKDRTQQLQDLISGWSPSFGVEADGERELAAFIKTAIDDRAIPDAQVVLSPAVASVVGVSRPDIAVYWNSVERPDIVAIELVTLNATSRFFGAVERALRMPFEVIVVVVGSEDKLSKLRGDAERLLRIGGHVQVVLVASDMRLR